MSGNKIKIAFWYTFPNSFDFYCKIGLLRKIAISVKLTTPGFFKGILK